MDLNYTDNKISLPYYYVTVLVVNNYALRFMNKINMTSNAIEALISFLKVAVMTFMLASNYLTSRGQ